MIPIIIESLLIYKFDISIMKNMICMLLLLHNASSTYVCHSPSAFFFLTPREKSIGNYIHLFTNIKLTIEINSIFLKISLH